jgi:4-amino-4-deoxy-L-arabinose transferase-like glycosyltransferase
MVDLILLPYAGLALAILLVLLLLLFNKAYRKSRYYGWADGDGKHGFWFGTRRSRRLLTR